LQSAPAMAQLLTHRSFVPTAGSVEITGMPARPTMVGLDISNGTDLVPFHFPIHVYFGVNDDLALGPIHEIGPFFGGGGLCVNCDRLYDDLGLGILYALMREQKFELDFNGDAPLFLSFRGRIYMSMRGGVLGRVNLGQVAAFVFDPSLQIGISGRPDSDGGNKDFLWAPAWFYFNATESVAPFVGFGFGGRVEDFGDTFTFPVEGGCLVSIGPNMDVGGVFQFYNLLGRGGNADGRQLGFLGRFRFGGR